MNDNLIPEPIKFRRIKKRAQEIGWDLDYVPRKDVYVLINNNGTKTLESRKLSDVDTDLEILKMLLRRKENEDEENKTK